MYFPFWLLQLTSFQSIHSESLLLNLDHMIFRCQYRRLIEIENTTVPSYWVLESDALVVATNRIRVHC
jgi:hypothetical protein